MASPEEMVAKMVANLKQNTGKTLAQWLKVVAGSGCEKHGEIIKLLKGEHGVTHGYANLIAHESRAAGSGGGAAATRAKGGGAIGGEALVEAQYSRAKAELRPLYEALITAVRKFGADVEVSPKKTYVSLRRSKQFALIQPSTKTRIDVGVNLKGVAPKGRLEASGSFNSMVSHRVRVESKKDVNAELKGWLEQAYKNA